MTAIPSLEKTTPDTMDGRDGRSRRGLRLGRWLQVPYWIVLLFFAVLFIYPFVWLISASFKTRAHVFDNKLIPVDATLHNFSKVWDVAPLARWLLNSLIVGTLAGGTVTISSAIVAFGFAYFRFRARGFLFGLVLATMMLPGAVTMIPVYVIWKELGFLGTQVPLWAANLFGSAFYIFLLRQFFLTIPRELFEAARVDGCSYWGMFRRIALPLSWPSLVIVFVFEFQASWNDLMKPLIYLGNKTGLYTVPLGLNSLFVQFNPIAGGHGDFQYIVTASLITTIPMIALFMVGQRYFVEGIATQGRKG
ncbi:MAG TPA: carbohydrate ABC transporter permease [Mycobacteriales bacterium]|nr:carbohydrate ABC transporter permease [Mycobacteriales bacterium]